MPPDPNIARMTASMKEISQTLKEICKVLETLNKNAVQLGLMIKDKETPDGS